MSKVQRQVVAADAQMDYRVCVGVDIAALDKVSATEPVAVVGHADAVRTARSQGLLAERGAGAATRGLYFLDDQGRPACVLVDKVVHQRVLCAKHAEVELCTVSKGNPGCFCYGRRLRNRSTLPAAGGRQQSDKKNQTGQ